MLLAGGGPEAEARLMPLRQAGACIRAVAFDHGEAFRRTAEALGGVEILDAPFQPAHLDGVRLAVAATDEPGLAAAVAREAAARGIFCNVQDDPEASDAFFAATLRRGPWRVAVGTDGAFPGLARMLRDVLARLIPERHGPPLEELARLRLLLLEAVPDADLRRRRLERLLRAFRRLYFPIEEERP